jgi:brefeldin A-resistance guanine nucleotide exchange factor 1
MHSFFVQIGGLNNEYALGSRQVENGNIGSDYDGQPLSTNFASNSSTVSVATGINENTIGSGNGKEAVSYDSHLMTEPYGVPAWWKYFTSYALC